jgi:hypothetical protein
MEFKTFEGIHTVEPDIWNRVTDQHPYAGWLWCDYGEQVQKRKGHYLIALDGDQAVGGAIFWVLREESIPTRNPAVRWFLNTYLWRRPLVVSRTAIFTDHKGFFLPPDPNQRASVLGAIQRLGMDLVHQNKGSFLVADYLFENEVDQEWGSQIFRFKDFMNIGTHMKVKWDTFDAYMLALKEQNKKAHKNVRHNSRYAQEEGITLRFQHEKPPVDDILRLVGIKMKHYKVPFDGEWTRRVIDIISNLPELNSIWVLAYLKDNIVGCECLLHDDKEHICKPILYGRDYNAEYVYFYMCYEDIRYAIENLGVKTIIYDTEAYDFKHRIGFEPDARNNMVVYPHSWLERSLISLLAKYMND